jgi:lysozyme
MIQGFDVEAMVAELSRDEGGNRLHVYDDATGHDLVPGTLLIGHPTIGIGRALDTHGISLGEGQGLLANDLNAYLMELRPLPWFAALDPIRQRAIINMRHQLGLSGLLSFRQMIAAITRQDWAAAVAAGMASKWATVQSPARARRVLAQLRDGTAPAATPIA